jgi:hypothetical protein
MHFIENKVVSLIKLKEEGLTWINLISWGTMCDSLLLLIVAVIGEGGEKSVTCQCPLWGNIDQLQCPTCSRTVARDFTLGEKIVERVFCFFVFLSIWWLVKWDFLTSTEGGIKSWWRGRPFYSFLATHIFVIKKIR